MEECDEYGEPLTNQWDETPPQSAPPVFTPPDIPNFLKEPADDDALDSPQTIDPPPPQQPAPVLTMNGMEPTTKPDASQSNQFSIKLTRDQRQQYGSQFQGGQPTIPSKFFWFYFFIPTKEQYYDGVCNGKRIMMEESSNFTISSKD